MLIFALQMGEGCKRDPNTSTLSQADTTAQVQDTLSKDFVVFFDNFHADSAFQMAHITFPLEGLPNSIADTATNERYYWTREKWTLHRPFTDPSQQFEQYFTVVGDRLIEHWVHMKGTNLYLQRRFAHLSDGWHLIYYAGMRPRKVEVEGGQQN